MGPSSDHPEPIFSSDYDTLNRLDVVDDITFGKQLTYGYDANGNRTRDSEGGVDHVYEYDARNLLAAARVGAAPRTFFAHDPLGRRSFVSRPNGVRTDYSYDHASQVSSIVHSKDDGVLLGFSYAYDGQGKRVSKTREDGTAEVYGYDSSMRLTQVDYGSAKTVEYTLDGLGNRTSEVQTVRPATGPSVITTWSGTFNAFNQQLYVSATRLESKAKFFATHGKNPGGYVIEFFTRRSVNIGGKRPDIYSIEFGSAADQEFLFPGLIPIVEDVVAFYPVPK